MRHLFVEVAIAAIEAAVREVYPIGGPDRMTWPEMLLTFRDAISGGPHWRKPLAIPAWKAKAMAIAAEALGLGRAAPFNVDQVIMSQEDSTCEIVRVRHDLGVEPAPFREALSRYAARL